MTKILGAPASLPASFDTPDLVGRAAGAPRRFIAKDQRLFQISSFVISFVLRPSSFPRLMLHTELIPAREKSRRLLIMLHGLGDSIAGYRWMPAALDLPWLNYLLVDAPDEYFGGYSWYDFTGDLAPGVDRSRKLLLEVLEQQQSNGFPADQIVLGGFSQGCLMSLEVGLRYPQRLAGIIGISGYICNPEKLIADLPP